MKTRKRETSKAKRVLSLLLAVLMVIGVIQITSPFQKAKAAVGDTPAHTKNLTDNHDGTYTLSLDVVGDAEKKPNNINVIVIMDTSGSMNQQRMTAAKNAVNSLANSLFAYNTTSEPNTVQMALVDFSTHASVVSGTPTNSYSSFSRSVQNLSAEGGTNWEAALKAANNVNFGDSDQTFVVFVSDGNPTFRDTEGTTRITDNRYYRYDNIFYDEDGVYGLGSDNPNNTNYSVQSMQYCYDHAVDDAKALADKVTPGNFFTIGAFGNVDRMEQLTDDAGSDSSKNYYSASDTAALNQAISDILAKIEMAGIANVEVDDGTTNQVTTTSGAIAELLEVDESSYKYYRSGGSYGSMQPWADAPKAELVDGTVEWDLASVGVLENGVRYTVTFDVYPSQYTYDTIAQLKNGDIQYSKLDPEVQKYIVDNGDGSYTLLTNTNASLSWDDTRDDAGQQTASYINPDPVATDAQTLTINKEWEGADPDVKSLPITVMMGGKEFHTATLSSENNWETTSYVSVGVIKNGQALPGALGHDFSFAELDDTQYHWELDAPTVRPMLVNGTLTMLVKVDADHPAPSGATTYTIEGATYYVDSAAGGLTATNHRRSNLNLTKVVTGEDAPEDATFPFTLTVNNSKAPATEPTDDPEHNSDYWVWFSIYDTKAGATVTDATISGATGPNADGYYYAPSGSRISVQMKADWNLRFTNLPSGTTYTFVEGDLADGFAFKKAELTQGEDSTFSGGKTTTGTIETTKTSFYVTYTNDYQLTDLEITKVWDDANNQDGKRLTPEQLAEKLTLSPAVEGATPTVTDNGNNTYTITYTGLPRFNNNGQEVTYTVTESAIDGYTTTGSPANDHGTITNTHTPEVTSVTVKKVWEDNNNIGGIQPASITAQLTADGTASGDPVALNAGNKWTYTWENLPKYKEGKEIVYSADETAVPAGYTKTGPEKTTAEDGTITFTVTNTYDPKPVSVDPPVQKVITGKDDLYNNGKFTFTIEATSPADAPMPANTSITNSTAYELEGKTGYYEFGEIEFTVPGTYTYLIKESGSVDGVTNDPAGAEGKSITFTVKDDGKGNLTVNPTTDQVDLSFTNVYDADGEASIVVNKEITGAAWPTGKTLILTIEGKDNAPMPEETTATLTAAGSVTFGPIAYGLTDAGKTYEYTITESSFGAGWSGAPASIKATVAVTDNGDGTLSTTVTYDPTDATFTNTYTATGTAVLEATKAIEGAGWPEDGEITFTLAGTESAPMPAAGGESVTLTEPGKATFGTINYTEADAGMTYTYTISEDGFGTGWTGSGDITATVVVTDNGDGTLSTAITYDPEGATITNTYVAEGEIELFAGKKLEAEEGLNAPDVTGEYTLTLEAQNGAPMPEGAVDGKVEITNADGDGTMTTFGTIAFDESDAGQTYTYKVTESGTVAGVSNGTTEYTVTVTVTDNGDGTLTATATPNANTLFTNTYEVGSTTVSFPVEKKLVVPEGLEGPTEWSYTINVAANDGAPAAENMTGTVSNANESVTFGPFTYSAPGEYTYTVTESGTVAGVTNDAAAATGKTVTVTVVDNGDGTLTATASTDEEPVVFTNTYTAEPATVTIPATKVLVIPEGLTGPTNASWTVSIAAASDGAPMPETTSYTVAPGQTVSFENIEYTKPGEYQYTVSESGEVAGVTNGQTEYTVKVTVEDNGDGTLTATADYDAKNPVTFTNTYSVKPTTASFEVTKNLTGTPLTAGAFEFTLTGAEGAPMPEKTEATNDEEGKVAFDDITYEAPGTYTYTIAEKNGGKGGYSYDTNTVTVTVTVKDNGDGTLTATPAYSDTEFNNTYKASGDVDLTAAKELKGRTLEEGQFKFQLLDENGNVIETVTNNASGAVQFTTIPYDQTIFDEETSEEEASKEETSEEERSEEESSEAPAENSEESELKADESSATEESVTEESAVEESKAEETTTEESAATETTDEAASEESAEEAEAVEETGTQSYAEKLLEIAEATEKGAAEQDIVLTPSVMRIRNAETGELVDVKAVAEETTPRTKTFTYTIREVNDGKSGYTYDDHEITVTVTVVDNGDGTLTATPSYEGEQTFINTYEAYGATGEGAISGTKTSEKLAEGQFTFQLIDKDNNVIEEVTNDAEGNFVFSALTYEIDAEDQSDLGTHTYTIVEVNDGQTGYTYDEKVAEVTVNVTDNGDGTLNCAVSYKDGAAPEFNNPYKPLATSIGLKGTKELTGFDLTAGQFTFTIAAETEGAPLPKNTEVTNDASGNISFGTITYDEVGEYVYTISEINGGAKGYTYDETTYTVTVNVEDVEGQLVATVTGADEIKFVNTYEAEPTKIVLKANKVLTGRDLKDGEFEFTVSQGENVLAKGKNDKDGNIVFDEIELRYAGTYKFTLKEVIPESKDENVTYDENAYEVTVIVKDDGSGTLIVETLADGATGVVFKNTYEKPEEPPVVPPTGDHTNIWIWVAIMIAAGLEFASLLYIKLRKKANR